MRLERVKRLREGKGRKWFVAKEKNRGIKNQMSGGNTNGSESKQQSECVLGLLGSSVAHQ